MSGALASFLCLLFVLFVVAREGRREKPHPSLALWIPLFWVITIGSKPLTNWLGLAGDSMENAEDYLEGSPVDRIFFLALIVAGLGVLFQRRVNWSRVFTTNKWLIIYFLYLAISTLWSEYTFVAFKRWIKDLGNVVMVLVILTEADPISATRTVLLRCAYLVLPFSIVYIKYYPALGRYYDQWTGTAYYCGVTGNKNALGMSLFVSALALLWKVLDLWGRRKGPDADRTGLLLHLAFGGMVLWLLKMAHSSTAVVCTVLGAAIMIAMRLPAIRRRAARFGLYFIGALLLLFIANATFDLGAAFVELVGRDMTFTGRTDIWKLVLSEPINPVLGVGFYSFWLGDRVDRLSEAFFYKLNQAHNGYLETYLNTGYLGVALLLIALVAGINRVKKSVAAGSPYAALRLAFIATILFYNMTEATFNRLNLVWFVLLLALMDYSAQLTDVALKPRKTESDNPTPSSTRRREGIRLEPLKE